MTIPGYDAWKLATPPQYECDGPEFPCPKCSGQGEVYYIACYYKCEAFNGTGEDPDEGWVEIPIECEDDQ